MSPVRSSLAKFNGHNPATDEEIEQMRRKAWLQQGVAMIKPAEIVDEWLRQGLTNHMEKLYGRRTNV